MEDCKHLYKEALTIEDLKEDRDRILKSLTLYYPSKVREIMNHMVTLLASDYDDMDELMRDAVDMAGAKVEGMAQARECFERSTANQMKALY